MKKIIFTICMLLSASPAFAIRYSLTDDPFVPYQRKAFVSSLSDYADTYAGSVNAVTGSGAKILAFKPRGATSALSIGASGFTRSGALVIKKLAPAIPYVGLALGAYTLYSDIRNAVLATPASKLASPKLVAAFTDPTTFGVITKDSTVNMIVMTSDGQKKITASAVKTVDNGGCLGISQVLGPGTAVATEPGYSVFYISDPAGDNCSLWPGTVNFDAYMVSHVVDTTPSALAIVPDPEAIAVFEAYNAANDTAYMAELDTLFRSAAASGVDVSPEIAPVLPEIAADLDAAEKAIAAVTATTAAATAAATAVTAATTAATTAQSVRDAAAAALAADPTNLTKQQALAAAEVALAAAEGTLNTTTMTATSTIAAQAEAEALVMPDMPSNTYDSIISAPDKKNIPDLLASMVAGSPLVSMVNSFSITTLNASCAQPVGLAYGQELSFDFCRWESYLLACGGLLIIITQGFSVLVVIRGW